MLDRKYKYKPDYAAFSTLNNEAKLAGLAAELKLKARSYKKPEKMQESQHARLSLVTRI